MKLFLKELQTPGLIRTMYVVVPDSDPKELWKSSSITILREEDNEASVKAILNDTGIGKLVDEQRLVLLFPNPIGGSWNYTQDASLPKDSEYIIAINESLNTGVFTEGWRMINDVHYLLGFGSGASLINTLVSVSPSGPLAAAVCTVGGVMTDEIIKKAVYSPIPALIIDGDAKAIKYYIEANKAEPTKEENLFVCNYNLMQMVYTSNEKKLTPALAKMMWEGFFRIIRRTNTTAEGDVDRRIVPEECGFEWHIDDKQLGDNNGIGHDWLESIPSCVKTNPDKKVPLIIFSHGMSDNPLKAADMAKFHELGEREGFITVYPFSSNRFGWNLNLSVDAFDDVGYYLALIEYLKKKYPIDETRIYTSGFSNGAGMAMVFAMTHPEIVAATCPIDSTFPYAGMRFFNPGGRPTPFISPVLKPGEEPVKPFMPKEDPDKNLAPLHAVEEKQKTDNFRMPVIYFYGTRESEYPIRAGCNQEYSYNFWKKFNNITIKETTDAMEPDAVGVIGDEVTEFYPSTQHPNHKYSKHTFYTNDAEKKDYYNFLLMHGKAHEVHPIERELGWAFISRFSRNADGSLNDSKK